jgi:lysophospholipase L1-like esterase
MQRLLAERSAMRLDPAGARRFAEANAAAGAADRPRAVLFGDSRVEQWAPLPDLGAHEILVRGIPGQSTAQMRLRFEADVLALAPRAVVIQAGINDLAAGQLASRREEAIALAAGNLTELVVLAGAQGISTVLTTVIRPAALSLRESLTYSSAALLADVAVVNAKLRTLSLPGLRLVDADARLAGASAALPDAYAVDMVHLTPAAYAVLNEEVAKAVGA